MEKNDLFALILTSLVKFLHMLYIYHQVGTGHEF